MSGVLGRRALHWCGRFLYAMAWPACLYYAFLVGGSADVCLRENGRLFGWTFFIWAFSVIRFWPVALVALAGCIAAANGMPTATRGVWSRRAAWFAGGVIAAALVGVAVGGMSDVCHVIW